MTDDAPVAARLEEAEFEAEMAREVGKRWEARAQRLEAEVRRLEANGRRLEVGLAASNAELETFRGRLAERDRYVKAIHDSGAWRLIQKVRGLFGRRWAE
jgi:hypothetical protein